MLNVKLVRFIQSWLLCGHAWYVDGTTKVLNGL